MKFLPHLLLLTLVGTSYAKSKEIYIPPPASPSQMVSAGSVVVIGKVTKIETDMVEVAPYVGAPKEQPKQPYKIASIKVSESLLGAKGVTTIQVGFPANAGNFGGYDDIEFGFKGGRGYRYGQGVALTEGQEGIFILSRHFEGDFYVFASGNNITPVLYEKKATGYDKSLAEVKTAVLAVKDPIAALKSKEKEDRINAASFLAQRYRQWNSPKPAVEVDIPSDEAKLIIQVLLEMPWAASPTDPNPIPYRCLEQNLHTWFARDIAALKFAYPTPPAGATQDEVQKLYKEAVTKFINTNMDKITLKKFVEKK